MHEEKGRHTFCTYENRIFRSMLFLNKMIDRYLTSKNRTVFRQSNGENKIHEHTSNQFTFRSLDGSICLKVQRPRKYFLRSIMIRRTCLINEDQKEPLCPSKKNYRSSKSCCSLFFLFFFSSFSISFNWIATKNNNNNK